jgi:hypothetical protein
LTGSGGSIAMPPQPLANSSRINPSVSCLPGLTIRAKHFDLKPKVDARGDVGLMVTSAPGTALPPASGSNSSYQRNCKQPQHESDSIGETGGHY